MTDITCKLRTSPISTKSHERDALGCRAGDFSRNRQWNQCASHVRRNQDPSVRYADVNRPYGVTFLLPESLQNLALGSGFDGLHLAFGIPGT